MPDAAAGCPGHRAILADEDLMQIASMAWAVQVTRNAAIALRTSSYYGQAAAAEQGMGVAVLPHYLARRRTLTRIPAPDGPPRELWLVVHEDTRHTPRIRALADALSAGLRERSELLCETA